jgi:hypothetical protein
MNRKRLLTSFSFKVPSIVAGLRSGFWVWPSHQVGRINFYFKKIQNGVVLVKKKVNGLQSSFAGSRRVMIFSIFSSTRLGHGPGSARWAWPGFQNYGSRQSLLILPFFFRQIEQIFCRERDYYNDYFLNYFLFKNILK